ncbi:hypothetical protein CHS0354_000711 [Potamilus streckersoni]|uniref:4Fe-4S ferredoxin-type domain-containing protein n=1 Tax=Potamilus streckersoni TaxID=2493646 RepID=A0AAE0T729_9BIVA|nr:hypothetical protein CHS0354_000711 [Potamilus streckersoni]
MINNEHIEVEQESEKFGAKDATDLIVPNAVAVLNDVLQILQEKRFPPEKLIEEIGKGENLDKTLLDGYISEQELMACTTCFACVEACPILINPLDIIMQLRWGLVMDESRVQNSLNTTLQNIENNGTPWQFSASQRGAWIKTI